MGLTQHRGNNGPHNTLYYIGVRPGKCTLVPPLPSPPSLPAPPPLPSANTTHPETLPIGDELVQGRGVAALLHKLLEDLHWGGGGGRHWCVNRDGWDVSELHAPG